MPDYWTSPSDGTDAIKQPDLVRDLVRGIKTRCGESFPVSIKIRIDDDPQYITQLYDIHWLNNSDGRSISLFRCRHTSRLVKTALAAGVSFITVHGESEMKRVTKRNLRINLYSPDRPLHSPKDERVIKRAQSPSIMKASGLHVKRLAPAQVGQYLL